MPRFTLLVLSLLLPALASCRSKPESIQIGYKDFPEQALLGHMLSQVVDASGRSSSLHNCGDTDGCQRALAAGQIDLMVEYTGTGALYASNGNPSASSLESLRASYAASGLRWLEPLGFDNGYRVVMDRQRAEEARVRDIAGLASLGSNLRLASPETYLQRPGDGLAALLRRHGLRMRGQPIVMASSLERVEALRRGDVDVGIFYGTDSVLLSDGLVVLEDSLRFYPSYDAVVLGRSAILEDATLVSALAKLEGRFDNASLQKLLYSIETEGHSPAVVAASALGAAEISEARKEPLKSRTLLVARASGFAEAGLASVRKALPEGPIELSEVGEVKEALAQGKGDLAVLGAGAFFDLGGVRDNRIEAVAVLGTRYLHILRREDDQGSALAGIIAVPASSEAGGLVARALLPSAASSKLRELPLATALQSLRSGGVDAVMIYKALGDEAIASAIASGFALQSFVPEGLALRAPYLRRVRIPASTYVRQEALVETVAAQVVIAAPSKSLGQEEVMAIVRGTGVHEQPDPILPTAERGALRPRATPVAPDWLSTLLNLGAIAFLLFAASLMWRPGIGKSLGEG